MCNVLISLICVSQWIWIQSDTKFTEDCLLQTALIITPRPDTELASVRGSSNSNPTASIDVYNTMVGALGLIDDSVFTDVRDVWCFTVLGTVRFAIYISQEIYFLIKNETKKLSSPNRKYGS